MKRIVLLCVLLTLVLAGCTTVTGGPGSGPFTETSFTVDPGQKHTVAVVLPARRAVDGSFSVSGAENTIDFYVKGPENDLVYGVVRSVGGQNFEVRAEVAGTYVLYFDNSISFGAARRVSLRYRVR